MIERFQPADLFECNAHSKIQSVPTCHSMPGGASPSHQCTGEVGALSTSCPNYACTSSTWRDVETECIRSGGSEPHTRTTQPIILFSRETFDSVKKHVGEFNLTILPQ